MRTNISPTEMQFTFQYGGLRTPGYPHQLRGAPSFTFQYGGLRTRGNFLRAPVRKHLHSNMED